jgi:hypothetical protein
MIGTDIDLPLSELVSLDLYHAGADYLSDQKPKKYEFRPYLGSLQWPYTYDSNVLGGDLLLAGSACDKGVGMHSASRLSYDLQEKYRYFETLVGLDSHSGREGSARVQVWVDGKPRLDRHQEVTAKSQPLSIREEIAGANELILEVDFGSYGDVQARVNWGAARVIR